jgi:hypothetical protein
MTVSGLAIGLGLAAVTVRNLAVSLRRRTVRCLDIRRRRRDAARRSDDRVRDSSRRAARIDPIIALKH